MFEVILAVLFAALYLLIGLGAAKLFRIHDKSKDVVTVYILTWPLALLVFGLMTHG